MTNTIQLTETEVEFLYEKVKLSKDLPKDLLIKLENLIKENRVERLQNDERELENLKKFNSDTFLQKVYNTLVDDYKTPNYSPINFMDDIQSKCIKVFDTLDEWFQNYISRIYEIQYIKSELRDLVQEEINEDDKGKTVLHKLFEHQLETDPELYLVDNKIVVCYF